MSVQIALAAEVERLRAELAWRIEERDRYKAVLDATVVEAEKMRAELAACRARLLGIYDNLSDPPVPEEHMRAMCKRIEEMFPDVFDESRKGEGE